MDDCWTEYEIEQELERRACLKVGVLSPEDQEVLDKLYERSQDHGHPVGLLGGNSGNVGDDLG